MDISTILTVGWRLAALVLGIGHWGWWLAALEAPKSAVLVAGLLVVYGLGVGWGSVVPASGVIAMAIALVVAFDILPPFWASNLHYKYWAYTVLLLWATSIAVVCLRAAVGQDLGQIKRPYRLVSRLAMVGSLLLILRAGAVLYQAHWPGWIPWGNL